MNEFHKWVTEHLDIREDVQRKLKIGDLVEVVDKDQESKIYEFLGYEHCKWIDYGDTPSCLNCKGKFTLKDVVTNKGRVFCGTFTIRKDNYSRVKLISPDILSEELFEI